MQTNIHSAIGWLLSALAVMGLFGCGKDLKAPKKIVVGIVNVTPLFNETVATFKQGLAEKGYVEGRNLTCVYEGPLGRMDRVDAAIGAILAKKPDLIVAFTTPVAAKAQRAVAGTDIPVLFAPVNDPLGSGFVKDLKAPGGHLTGIHVMAAENNALGWLVKLVPDLKSMYVPYSPEDKAMMLGLKGLREAAAARGIALVVGEFHSQDEVPRVLDRIPADVQAVWQLPSPFWGIYVEPFVKACLKHKKPLKTHAGDWARAGAFMAYGIDTRALGVQLSRLAHKILSGTPAAVLPVEQPEYFLSINLRTAEAIGIQIPDRLLKMADRVIRE